MPLVVPGVNSAIDKKTEWLEKLKGKKYLEDQESTSATDGNSFTTKDLPENRRVLKPNSITTMDYREDRLNVHLDENNIVQDVGFF